jgi:hypothetical protein
MRWSPPMRARRQRLHRRLRTLSRRRPSLHGRKAVALVVATRSTRNKKERLLPRLCPEGRQAELASALPMTLPHGWPWFLPEDGSGRSAKRHPDRSLDEATSCSQSQIGRDRHLRRCEAAQVEAASTLSVVVRWGPVMTAVNGTLVARPPRMPRYPVAPLAPP